MLGTDIGLQIFAGRPRRIPRPDVAFVRAGRITPAVRSGGFLTIPPDLIVEVVSPGDSAVALQRKVVEYLGAGMHTVWVVCPDTRQVVVHTASSTLTLNEGDTLEGGEAVPGVACRVSEFFPGPLPEEQPAD